MRPIFTCWKSMAAEKFFVTPWPWPWIFMVKFWNSCISEWEGRFTLLKGGGSRSFMTMTMTIWWPRSDSDPGDFSCRRAVDSSSLYKSLDIIILILEQGWGQFLFFNSIPIPIPLRSIPIPIPLGRKIAIPIPIPIPFYQFQFQFQFLFINSFSIPF